jgi:hypothetical protein
MAQLDKLESSLDDAFNKKSPVKLPESSRKSLAGAMWWLALIGGVLQLYVAWNLWYDWRRVDEVLDSINSFAAAYGVDAGGTDLGFMFYASLITLAVSGALLLLATPGLKAMKKAGWNLVFYGLIVNLVYGVVVAFSDYGEMSNLFGAVLSSIVGGFLLFQVRSHFKAGAVAHKAN